MKTWQEAEKTHNGFRARLYPQYPLTFARPPEYGIQTGFGWFGLVEWMAGEIESVLARRPDLAATFTFGQIKEKYAHLTCYYRPRDPEIKAIIERAEKISMSICEECGSVGRWHMADQWEYIACPLHVRGDDDGDFGVEGGMAIQDDLRVEEKEEQERPKFSMGALVPPDLAWQEGKNAGEIASLTLLVQTREMLRGRVAWQRQIGSPTDLLAQKFADVITDHLVWYGIEKYPEKP